MIVDKGLAPVHRQADMKATPPAHSSLQRPTVWVLKGLRAGDTAQAMDLALQLGARVEARQLQFNATSVVPNWLLGARVSHLTVQARAGLSPPWPDAVVATGRRTAAVALWIKHQSGGRTRLIQIGRPRMNLDRFDLVLTTPQYGLPQGGNVVELPLPITLPKSAAAQDLADFEKAWQHLPRPWLLAVVGGQKFPLRLGAEQLAGFGAALAARRQRSGGSVMLVDSPRSPAGALAVVAAQLGGPLWHYHRGQGPNPYGAALALCDVLAVTSDSASMLADMVATGKPTFVFRLPRAAYAPRWQAATGPLAALAARGILHAPRDVDGLVAALIQRGVVADLASGQEAAGGGFADEQAAVVERVKRLVWGGAAT
jgi:uncharacterized protein